MGNIDFDAMLANRGIVNDADWLTNALAWDDLVAPASEDAGTTRVLTPLPSAATVTAGPSSAIRVFGQSAEWINDGPPARAPSSTTISSASAAVPAAAGIIVCPTVDSIPGGKQPAKILKCGIARCASTTLFDRKYELERHMKTHGEGAFTCPVAGCERMFRGFPRSDKLADHKKKVHGM